MFSPAGSGANLDRAPTSVFEMITRIGALLVSVIAVLAPIQGTAEELRPRSVLVLDNAERCDRHHRHRAARGFDRSRRHMRWCLNCRRLCSSVMKQGMGIGRSIARTIVQAHKGRIWVENQIEGGAVFHLSLPVALSQEG
jgi:hypothetical protein